MKKSSIIGVLILCFAFWGKAQVRNEIRVPDPEGYRTLKCDFHIHTVFSDGLVWPTVRVDEAYREGLDAIALTEHLEYRPHRQDIIASHNRSYEIAEKTNFYQTDVLKDGFVQYHCVNDDMGMIYQDFLQYLSEVKMLRNKYLTDIEE